MQVFFEHKLPTDVIVVRQDNAESKFIETNAGIYYPLIKINNTTIAFSDIIECSFTVGTQFFPTFSCTISDSTYQFRQNDFSKGLMFMTIFIGNPNDEVYKPIKNTYLITSIESEPGNPNLSFESVLFVPGLFEYKQYAFTGTSLSALKDLASYVKLGFVSNINASNDTMTWISPGKLINYMYQIIDGAYISDDDSVLCYIDQYANLNYISLKSAYSATDRIKCETNVLTGEKLLQPKELVLTSNKLDRKDKTLIQYYTPINNYGELAINRNDALIYTQLVSDYTSTTPPKTIIGSDQLGTIDNYTTAKSVNAHSMYYMSAYISKHNRHLLQGTKLSIQLDNYAPSACLYMTIPVEIYSYPTRTKFSESNNTQNLDSLDKNETVGPTNSHVLQRSLSGDSIVTEITYTFQKRSIQTDDSEFRIQQYLKVFLKN